jgi:uncharacterized glyoxalase superfamily protein PhnB
MKLNAVGVSSKNIPKAIEFYTILGLKFPELKSDEDHIESITEAGGTKLMIDTVNMITSILGEEPKPSNHSTFAIQYDTPEEIDAIVKQLEEAGFTIVKQPWDAFWGQHYAIVADPEGYMVDLYVNRPS